MSASWPRWCMGSTALALALGGVGAWAVTGLFNGLRAAVLCTGWLGAQLLALRKGHVGWSRAITLLAVPVGWMAGAAIWDSTLIVLVAVMLAQIWEGASDGAVAIADNTDRTAPRGVGTPGEPTASRQICTLPPGFGLGIVVLAVAVGLLPTWGLLALLSVPWAVRVHAGSDASAFGEWSMAFNGQLALALLIKGLVG